MQSSHVTAPRTFERRRPPRCAVRCDGSQLDAGCECFSRVGQMGPAQPAARVAVATVWDGGSAYACAIPLWCQSALGVASVIKSAEVLIVSPTPSEDCPQAVHLYPNRTHAAAESYLRRHSHGRLGTKSGNGGAFALANLLKVALFSP